ncbi:hypothetical protein PMAYCL1PPCAC_00594, partial [Pristionchus mayeri]
AKPSSPQTSEPFGVKATKRREEPLDSVCREFQDDPRRQVGASGSFLPDSPLPASVLPTRQRLAADVDRYRSLHGHLLAPSDAEILAPNHSALSATRVDVRRSYLSAHGSQPAEIHQVLPSDVRDERLSILNRWDESKNIQRSLSALIKTSLGQVHDCMRDAADGHPQTASIRSEDAGDLDTHLLHLIYSRPESWIPALETAAVWPPHTAPPRGRQAWSHVRFAA